MSNVSAWNISAGSNNATPPNGAPEGQAPSTLNDVIRENMAAIARMYSDHRGHLTSAGSANAYTLTTNSTHAAIANSGLLVFIANHTNTGSATLAVDGLAAKTIRANGETLAAGKIVSGYTVAVVYNVTSDCYDLLTFWVDETTQLRKSKSADEQISTSTTFQDDEHLVGFALETGAFYAVEGLIIVTSTTAADFKMCLTFTDAPSQYMLAHRGMNTISQSIGTDETAGTGSIIGFTSNGKAAFLVSGMFQANAVDGGTVKFQWAQNSSSGNTTVHEGSWLKITRVS